MTRPIISSLFLAPLVVLGLQVASAQTSPTGADSAKAMDKSVAPDNTKSNRNPSNMNQTSDKQLNNSADIDVTRRIRSSVMADKDLSTYGHNVKIVTANGTVTLNGVVHTDEEKAAIGMQAASVVGKDHVVNDIKVDREVK